MLGNGLFEMHGSTKTPSLHASHFNEPTNLKEILHIRWWIVGNIRPHIPVTSSDDTLPLIIEVIEVHTRKQPVVGLHHFKYSKIVQNKAYWTSTTPHAYRWAGRGGGGCQWLPVLLINAIITSHKHTGPTCVVRSHAASHSSSIGIKTLKDIEDIWASANGLDSGALLTQAVNWIFFSVFFPRRGRCCDAACVFGCFFYVRAKERGVCVNPSPGHLLSVHLCLSCGHNGPLTLGPS